MSSPQTNTQSYIDRFNQFVGEYLLGAIAAITAIAIAMPIAAIVALEFMMWRDIVWGLYRIISR